MPQLKYELKLGDLLQIVILLVAGAVAYGKLDADVSYIRSQVDRLQGLTERVVRVETLIARPTR